MSTRATNLVRLLEEQDEIAARDMLFFFYKFSDRPACIHLFCNQIHTPQHQGSSCIFGQTFLAKWSWLGIFTPRNRSLLTEIKLLRELGARRCQRNSLATGRLQPPSRHNFSAGPRSRSSVTRDPRLGSLRGAARNWPRRLAALHYYLVTYPGTNVQELHAVGIWAK